MVRRPSSRPSNGSSASSRQPSRSTQSASDATTAEPAIPTDVSSMQPRNVRKPSSRARSSIRLRRPDPAALGELDVDPGDDPDQAVEVLVAGRSSRRRRSAATSAPGASAAGRSRRGRERLLDELDAEPLELGQERERRRRGVQPVLASTRIGPSKTSRTASSVARSPGPPHLILSAGKSRRAGGALGDDVGLVDADGEVGRREVGRQAEQLVDRARRVTLPTRSCRAMSMAHFAAPWPRMARLHAPGRRGEAVPASGSNVADGVEQQREDGRHRLGRLAVEPVRVALPHPDDAREPVVAQLDDDRRDAVRPSPWSVRAIRNGSRSAEAQDLVGQLQASCRADPRQRVDPLADGRPQPVRPEADRVVGRQPGLGRDLGDDPARLVVVRVERRVQGDGDDLRRRDQPGDPLVQLDERAAAGRSGTTRRAGGRSRARPAPACGP